MYYRSIYAVPDVPGKLLFKTSGQSCYVYLELERRFLREKGYNTPKRIIIGKLVQNDDRTLMYPNDNYFKQFPNEQPAVLPKAEKRSRTQKVGSFMVFEKIVKDYELDKKLKEIFGDLYGPILDLALYYIVCEDGTYEHFDKYAREHPLFTEKMHVYSDTWLSDMLAQITQDQIEAFIELWNSTMEHNQSICISQDSSNVNNQAGELSKSVFGNAKDDKHKRIINFSIAFDQTNRVPLAIADYHGALNDVSQLKPFIQRMKGLGYKAPTLILDRGYFGEENIHTMDDEGYHFLMMVKGHKELVCNLVNEKRGSFEYDSRCLVPGKKLYAVTVEHELYEGDGKTRYFHVIFSPEKAASDHSDLLDKIEALESYFAKHEGKVIKSLPDGAESYFDCHFRQDGDQRVLLFAEKKHDVISHELKHCGYFCLISSKKMSAEDAYLLYSGRDSTEKLFTAGKSFLGFHCLRVHSDKAASAKILLLFIALIVRNRLYTLLKYDMRKLNIKHSYKTVPSAIKELDTIEMSNFGEGGGYRLHNAFTKSQKLIFRVVGMNEDAVLARTKVLSQQLTDSEVQVIKEAA